MPEVIIAGNDTTPDFVLKVEGVDCSGQVGVAKTLTDAQYEALMDSHLADDVSLAPLRNLTVPTITGTAQSGQELTGHHGTYNNTPVSYTYRWLADAVAIGGATALTYTIVTGDVGKVITFEETATDTTGSVVATSVATAGVGPGYAYPSFTINANGSDGAFTESPTAQFNFTNTVSTQTFKADADIGDFLMRLDCPTGTVPHFAQIGLHGAAGAIPDYGTGYYELQFGGNDQAKAIHYAAASFADIPDGNGPIFILRLSNTLSVRYGGTGWADATPLVDATLDAYSQTLDRLFVVMEPDRNSVTMSFLALP